MQRFIIIILFLTSVLSSFSQSEKITVYFNHPVNNNASSIADAIYVSHFEDTVVAYINRIQSTLDIAMYSTESLPIVNAINAAVARGVVVRYIAAANTGTNNSELGSLSASIPMIQRPDDGEVMHNKFLIMDIADPSKARVMTGSTNHSDNSLHNDWNNMVIIQDQPLALAYKTEFEEMWGSTGDQPNTANSKFGAAKTDNTPHSFTIDGIPVELYFSPSDGTTSHIVSAVNSANTDLQFAMLTFINNDLGDAVIARHQAGVDVKGIIENIYYIGSEYSGLVSAGVNVLSHFTTPYFMHHKYGIVDANNTSSDPLVITGSHNWTSSAETDYDENTLIIHSAEIAGMYFEEFTQTFDNMTSIVFAKVEVDDVMLFYEYEREMLLVKSQTTFYKVEVFDIHSKKVCEYDCPSCHEASINIPGLSSGLYIICVHTSTSNSFKKIVIE
jgi:phosphatidylserine/phosphatidylglycerophosphate/cardiolipin synthase-like enzyme